MIHVDFETRSQVDIKLGTHRYAMDWSTEILFMAWAIEDDPVELWTPEQPFPKRLDEAVRDGVTIAAHSAVFERLIWAYVLRHLHPNIADPELEQYLCTMATARCNGLPGGLGEIAKCLGLPERKEQRGRYLIRECCVPPYNTDPKLLKELGEYCVQDVEVERSNLTHMRPMTDTELEDYWTNERINDRGHMIDRGLAIAAQVYANAEKDELAGQIHQLTLGEISKTQGTKLTRWVYENLPDEIAKTMHVWKKGEQKLTLDKACRERLMDLQDEIDPDVIGVVDAAHLAGASSTSKYKAMELASDLEDDRVRGWSMYAGAVGTGRFSGKITQPHNMPRDGHDDPETIRKLMLSKVEAAALIEESGYNVMQTLKRMLRYAIKAPPGKTFVAGDWSSIEARKLPWLADTPSARAKLDLFREIDADPELPDMYWRAAAELFKGMEREPWHRQAGKVSELALGFGGGVGAYRAMAKGMELALPTDLEGCRQFGSIGEINEAIDFLDWLGMFKSPANIASELIKRKWRKGNPWAPEFWRKLESAAANAIRQPGKAFKAGRVHYLFTEDMLGGALFCLLPSGRMLTYPQARIDLVKGRDGELSPRITAIKASWSPKAGDDTWPRFALWGGLLAENITQASAACLLRAKLRTLDSQLPIVLHVHDEIVGEVEKRRAKHFSRLLGDEMARIEPWMEGLPLKVDSWIGPRFRK